MRRFRLRMIFKAIRLAGEEYMPIFDESGKKAIGFARFVGYGA